MTILYRPCKPQSLGYNQITVKINRSLGDSQWERSSKDEIHGPFNCLNVLESILTHFDGGLAIPVTLCHHKDILI